MAAWWGLDGLAVGFRVWGASAGWPRGGTGDFPCVVCAGKKENLPDLARGARKCRLQRLSGRWYSVQYSMWRRELIRADQGSQRAPVRQSCLCTLQQNPGQEKSQHRRCLGTWTFFCVACLTARCSTVRTNAHAHYRSQRRKKKKRAKTNEWRRALTAEGLVEAWNIDFHCIFDSTEGLPSATFTPPPPPLGPEAVSAILFKLR